MHDYFGYPEANFDSPTRPCPHCRTKGLRKTTIHHFHSGTEGQGDYVILPAYIKCVSCQGDGYQLLCEDEIYDERCARLDHEAELKEFEINDER
jgi:hypothetical protein